MDEVFDKTPRFNNEMINRKKPSPTLVNGRKKLIGELLEHLGEKHLGMADTNLPKMSVYRTILLNTGLYLKRGEETTIDAEKPVEFWGFTLPIEIHEDPNLRHVWQIFEDFFNTANSTSPSFTSLIDQLIAPPIGLRRGIIPVLLTCAIQAFGRSISISYKGIYVKIIESSTIEGICATPDDYSLNLVALTPNQDKYIDGVFKCFKTPNYVHAEETDKIRLCYDAISKWKNELKDVVGNIASSPSGPSKLTRSFWQCISKVTDPVTILL
jgi:hypothetical protein